MMKRSQQRERDPEESAKYPPKLPYKPRSRDTAITVNNVIELAAKMGIEITREEAMAIAGGIRPLSLNKSEYERIESAIRKAVDDLYAAAAVTH